MMVIDFSDFGIIVYGIVSKSAGFLVASLSRLNQRGVASNNDTPVLSSQIRWGKFRIGFRFPGTMTGRRPVCNLSAMRSRCQVVSKPDGFVFLFLGVYPFRFRL